MSKEKFMGRFSRSTCAAGRKRFPFGSRFRQSCVTGFGCMGENKTYRCTLDVRGYELDSFGHVNHAVYVSYLEHARWLMLGEEAITAAKFQEWQRWPIIMSIEVNYLKPTYMYDMLDIVTTVTDHTRTSITFSQTVFRNGVSILKAVIRAVIINEKGRPAEIPAEVSRLWGAFPPPKPEEIPAAISLLRGREPGKTS